MPITKKIKNRVYVFCGLVMLLLIVVGIDNHNRQSSSPLIQYKPPSGNDDYLRVFAPDWSVSVPLLAMNQPPVAITDKKIYYKWVGSPQIPKEMIDLGKRGQPSPELLVQLELDLFLDTDSYKQDRGIYNPGIPVTLINFYDEDIQLDTLPKWSDYAASTKQIGEAINQPESTEKYIEDSRRRIKEAGNNIRNILGDDRVFIFAAIYDDREIYVDTVSAGSSLAFDTMGLKVLSVEQPNLWGNSDGWGGSSAPIHKLLELPKNTCLIVKAPVMAITENNIAKSLIWQRTIFAKKNACIYKVRSYMLGGGKNLSSITDLVTFAEELEEAVVHPQPIFHLRREEKSGEEQTQ